MNYDTTCTDGINHHHLHTPTMAGQEVGSRNVTRFKSQVSFFFLSYINSYLGVLLHETPHRHVKMCQYKVPNGDEDEQGLETNLEPSGMFSFIFYYTKD